MLGEDTGEDKSTQGKTKWLRGGHCAPCTEYETNKSKIISCFVIFTPEILKKETFHPWIYINVRMKFYSLNNFIFFQVVKQL